MQLKKEKNFKNRRDIIVKIVLVINPITQQYRIT
jgi:hypothetical protein